MDRKAPQIRLARANDADGAFAEELVQVFSPALIRLLELQMEPALPYPALAAYLKLDPMLAGKLLHLINSLSPGHGAQFVDLQRAAMAVGTGNLLKTLLALAMQKHLQPRGKRNQDKLHQDWRITLWGAVGAEAIAAHLCPQGRRKAFLAGLLRDSALLHALGSETPPPFLQGDCLCSLPKKGMAEQEEQNWGKRHEHLVADILLRQGLPQDLAEAVRNHHGQDNPVSLSPLSKSVALAARWARLLHGDRISPADLIAYELFLAQRLGLGVAQMDCFRAECAEQYNQLLLHLDIHNAPQEDRLYSQPLSCLRDLFFLAQHILNTIEQYSAYAAADTLGHQLLAFWQVENWDLFLSPDGSGEGEFFRHEAGEIKTFPAAGGTALTRPPGWVQMHIGSKGREYGALSLPRAQGGAENSTLPVYLHLLGMCLDERQRKLAETRLTGGLHSSPLLLARLDAAACICDASQAFLDAFGLTRIPFGRNAGDLLSAKLGVSANSLASVMADGQGRGRFLSAPEGHFPGTPIYLAHHAPSPNADDSLLLLGDVGPVSTLQSLALAHKELLETLFRSIDENICLLDNDGLILWADTELENAVGQDFFKLTRPVVRGRQRWHASILADISEPCTLRASMPTNGEPVPRLLHVSPLGAAAGRQYLVVIKKAPGKGAAGAAISPSSKQRDSLTGLYGYSQFHLLLHHLAQLAKKQRSHLGILFCVMGSLRDINLTQGFQKGDYALSRVAECLAAACRPGRDYPCRYGSDKFAILVTRATRILMDSIAHGIHEQLSNHTREFGATGLGLTLIAPGQAARPQLDLAKQAAKRAVSEAPHMFWSQ